MHNALSQGAPMLSNLGAYTADRLQPETAIDLHIQWHSCGQHAHVHTARAAWIRGGCMARELCALHARAVLSHGWGVEYDECLCSGPATGIAHLDS